MHTQPPLVIQSVWTCSWVCVWEVAGLLPQQLDGRWTKLWQFSGVNSCVGVKVLRPNSLWTVWTSVLDASRRAESRQTTVTEVWHEAMWEKGKWAVSELSNGWMWPDMKMRSVHNESRYWLYTLRLYWVWHGCLIAQSVCSISLGWYWSLIGQNPTILIH